MCLKLLFELENALEIIRHVTSFSDVTHALFKIFNYGALQNFSCHLNLSKFCHVMSSIIMSFYVTDEHNSLHYNVVKGKCLIFFAYK